MKEYLILLKVFVVFTSGVLSDEIINENNEERNIFDGSNSPNNKNNNNNEMNFLAVDNENNNYNKNHENSVGVNQLLANNWNNDFGYIGDANVNYQTENNDIKNSKHLKTINDDELLNDNSPNNDKMNIDKLYKDDEDYKNEDDKRSALRTFVSRRSQRIKDNGQRQFVPSISVGEFHGALTNLRGFFDNLKNNLELLHSKQLSTDQIKLLEGKNSVDHLKKEIYETPYHKPSGTAAFLHAIRTYQPSHRVRALVAMQPDAYRGTNYYDPNYMWSGLGK